MFYLQPHWMTQNLNIANQIGVFFYKEGFRSEKIKLVGKEGIYVAVAFCVFNCIMYYFTRNNLWLKNPDQEGRFWTFNFELA